MRETSDQIRKTFVVEVVQLGITTHTELSQLILIISQYSNNHRDEFTPFRYSLRCAKRRHKGCTLTLEDLQEQWELQQGVCPYTKLKLTLPEDGNVATLDVSIRASLDRIDSSKPYEVGNIQFISTPINYMKNSMSDEQTKTYLRVISANIIDS